MSKRTNNAENSRDSIRRKVAERNQYMQEVSAKANEIALYLGYKLSEIDAACHAAEDLGRVAVIASVHAALVGTEYTLPAVETIAGYMAKDRRDDAQGIIEKVLSDAIGAWHEDRQLHAAGKLVRKPSLLAYVLAAGKSEVEEAGLGVAGSMASGGIDW